MKTDEIKDMMGGTVGRFDGYGRHEPLVSMTCVYDDDAGETEVTFAVPVAWLISEMNSAGDGQWDWESLHGWLCSEYTSEDSQEILEKAVRMNKVAFYVIR